MKFSLRQRILMAAAGLAAALVGLVAYEAGARQTGQEIRLPMRAVDPRSLLSGHYAALDLGFARPEGAPCPPGAGEATYPRREASNDWVALRPAQDGAYTVAGAAPTRAEAARLGPVQVRGEAACAGPEMRLDIGVARFHADQKSAQALEARLRGGNVQAAAIVSVGRDGRARLVGVIAGDRRIDLPMF